MRRVKFQFFPVEKSGCRLGGYIKSHEQFAEQRHAKACLDSQDERGRDGSEWNRQRNAGDRYYVPYQKENQAGGKIVVRP